MEKFKDLEEDFQRQLYQLLGIVEKQQLTIDLLRERVKRLEDAFIINIGKIR